VPATEGVPGFGVMLAGVELAPDTRKGGVTVIILEPDRVAETPGAAPEGLAVEPSLTTGRLAASACVPQPPVRIQEAVPTTSRAKAARERGSIKVRRFFIKSLLYRYPKGGSIAACGHSL
jgi:hypothetical protein